MHGFGALLITLSGLSPSIGVFVVGSTTMHQAGSGVLVCFIAAALLGLAMAMVYAEAASAFPETGGEYTILGRALGPAWGVAVLGVNLLGFSIAQSLAGLGVVTYLEPLFPGLSPVPTAATLVLVVTVVAVFNIRINALVTGLFFGVELLALAALTGMGFAHAHRSLAPMILHPAVVGPTGSLVPASVALIGAATSGGIYAFNGYGAAVFLGEELHEAPRRIAKVVFLALGVAVITELLPVAAVMVGAPSLNGLLTAADPVPDFIAKVGGATLSKIMGLGVALAIFNAMIAVALMGGRQLYSTGRDSLWPSPVSRVLARINPRFGSPLPATIVVGAAALMGCFVDKAVLVLVLGNGNVAIYLGVCAAVVVGRRSGATAGAGYRMPFFPAPPLLAVLALIAVVWFDLHDADGLKGLAATVAVLVLGFGYYALVLRRRPAWTLRGPGLNEA